jgi:hypothetical protein
MSNTTEKLARKGTRAGGSPQVRLNVRHLSVLSATRIGFLVGLILGVLGIAAAMIVYSVLVSTGGFAQLDSFLGGALGGSAGASITSTISPGFVFAIAVAIAALNVVTTTVLGLLIALLYNATTRFTDGLLVGFSKA